MDMGGSTWGDPLDADGYTWSRGYPWGQGYAWSDGLHLEPRLHLVPGLYLEPRLHLVARLHLEPGLHLEPQPVVVEPRRAALVPLDQAGVDRDLGAERVAASVTQFRTATSASAGFPTRINAQPAAARRDLRA